MFDHKSMATDGLYPGLTTIQSVANRGHFIGVLTRKIKKIITASVRTLSMGLVTATNKLGGVAVENNVINNRTNQKSIDVDVETHTMHATPITKSITSEDQPKSITANSKKKRINL